MRCSFLSAAVAAVAKPASARTTARTDARRFIGRSFVAPAGSRPYERETLLGQRENLRHSRRHLDRARVDFDFLAGVALDRVDRVHADIELHALRDQAVDLRALGV